MAEVVKIGVLLPQSKQYNTLDRDFIRGIRLNNLNAKLHIENIGIASDSKTIIEKIQKLSLEEDINIFIGFLGHHNIHHVYEYASDNDIILIANDMGATMPYGKLKYNGVFINSFAMIESANFLGKYFSENNYNKIGISTSFYDAGYSFLDAIESSFANGTNFTGHYITPLQPRENEAEIMQSTINEFEAEAIFGFFSGLYAKENTSFLLENNITKKYPFFMMPFSIDESFHKYLENDFHDIHVVTPWIRNFTEECREFNDIYIDAHESSPTVFSLLGYESGLILKNTLDKAQNSKTEILKKAIEKLEFNGPRGIIKFDTEINRIVFDHHIYKMTIDPDGKVIPQITVTFKNNVDFIKSVIARQNSNSNNGWQNAYLCH